MTRRRRLHVRIGELEIDEARRELRRGAVAVAVQPKVLDVLLLLVRERDRVVSRDELRCAVWPGVVVAADSVNRAIGEVRRILGDDGRGQRMVRTHRGRGVRLVAPVADAPAEETRLGRDPILASIDAMLARVRAGRGGIRIVLDAMASGLSPRRLSDEARAAWERICDSIRRTVIGAHRAAVGGEEQAQRRAPSPRPARRVRLRS